MIEVVSVAVWVWLWFQWWRRGGFGLGWSLAPFLEYPHPLTLTVRTPEGTPASASRAAVVWSMVTPSPSADAWTSIKIDHRRASKQIIRTGKRKDWLHCQPFESQFKSFEYIGAHLISLKEAQRQCKAEIKHLCNPIKNSAKKHIHNYQTKDWPWNTTVGCITCIASNYPETHWK